MSTKSEQSVENVKRRAEELGKEEVERFVKIFGKSLSEDMLDLFSKVIPKVAGLAYTQGCVDALKEVDDMIKL